jgi:tRNA(Ile2) C34 agmatinyltransferase TiaS
MKLGTATCLCGREIVVYGSIQPGHDILGLNIYRREKAYCEYCGLTYEPSIVCQRADYKQEPTL